MVEKLFHLKLLKYVPKDTVYTLRNHGAMTLYARHRAKVLLYVNVANPLVQHYDFSLIDRGERRKLRVLDGSNTHSILSMLQ
jgi:hypothetical protein